MLQSVTVNYFTPSAIAHVEDFIDITLHPPSHFGCSWPAVETIMHTLSFTTKEGSLVNAHVTLELLMVTKLDSTKFYSSASLAQRWCCYELGSKVNEESNSGVWGSLQNINMLGICPRHWN